MEEWHAIQVLKRQGHGKKAVARPLKISRKTVKRYGDSLAPPSYRRAGASWNCGAIMVPATGCISGNGGNPGDPPRRQ